MSYSGAERRHSPSTTTYATTAAPPPTPSTQPTHISNSNEATDALLSRLLHRLPPSLSLSLPPRLNESGSSGHRINKYSVESDNYPVVPGTTTIVTPPSISLDELASSVLSSAQHGFFQLTDHSIHCELASSAESDAVSLFNLPQDKKTMFFPQNWPFGYDDGDDDDENQEFESFILDSECSSESTEINLVYLKQFTKKMEELGLEVLEALANAIGFENPVQSDPSRVCSQMWITNSTSNNNSKEGSGRVYPYVIGLHYQIRCQDYSTLVESSRVSVSPKVDSVLVTLGDIAQVWSNGKIKKVTGRPSPIVRDDNYNVVASQRITMSLLISLPVNSMVSPLRTSKLNNVEPNTNNYKNISNSEDEEEGDQDEWVFNAFDFEDYAWRIFHERSLDKDPLHRYRV